MSQSTYYLCLLSARSGREIEPKIAKAAHKIFPEAPEFDDAKLHAAVEKIASDLSTGAGPILAGELRAVIKSFSDQSGTPFCPPAMRALEG